MDKKSKANMMADYLKNKVLAAVDERIKVLSKNIADLMNETDTLKTEYVNLQAVKDEAHSYIDKAAAADQALNTKKENGSI